MACYLNNQIPQEHLRPKESAVIAAMKAEEPTYRCSDLIAVLLSCSNKWSVSFYSSWFSVW